MGVGGPVLVATPDSVHSIVFELQILSCHTIISISFLDLYHLGAINRLKIRLRGAYQCEAVLALTPVGKSLSTELWILLRRGSGLRLRIRLRPRVRVHLDMYHVELGSGLGLGLGSTSTCTM